MVVKFRRCQRGITIKLGAKAALVQYSYVTLTTGSGVGGRGIYGKLSFGRLSLFILETVRDRPTSLTGMHEHCHLSTAIVSHRKKRSAWRMNLIYSAYEELNNHLNNKLLVKYDYFAVSVFIHFSRFRSYVDFFFISNFGSIIQHIDNDTGKMLKFSYEFCVLSEI